MELPAAEFDLVPMADGGEGTVDAIVQAVKGEFVQCEVSGPLGATRTATYGLIGERSIAVIEMAEASGLTLLAQAERNPLRTSTYGCGELIADALDKGVAQIIIGIGGSATNDGGLGMCQALGAKFFDASNNDIEPPLTGADLERVMGVEVSALQKRLGGTRVIVASDVDNPLLGPTGATVVFGPQKGASAADLETLERGLDQAYAHIEKALGQSVRDRPGSGAAGGMGAALMALFDAELKPGVALVAELVQLEARLASADIVITGEGAVDFQTAHGKTPAGVAKLARQCNVPVVAIGGMLEDSALTLFDHGVGAIEASITKPCTSDEALSNARQNLLFAARRVAHWLQFAQSFNA